MVKTGSCWELPSVSYKPVYQTWSIIGRLRYIHCHVVNITTKNSDRHYLKVVSIVAEQFTTNFLLLYIF